MWMRCGSTLRHQSAPHHDGRAERRTRGCHCGRHDRRVTPVGLRSVPVGGSGGRVFAVGGRQWRSGAESVAGAGSELSVAGAGRGRLAAELAAAADGQPRAIASAIESRGCCRDDHGHPHDNSEVAARCHDNVPVDPAAPPAPAWHGDGRGSRPTGTAPEGIVPSRAQPRIAAAGLEPATPGL